MKMIGKYGQNRFSAVGYLFSDKLLVCYKSSGITPEGFGVKE
jgi:hypothetical protein